MSTGRFYCEHWPFNLMRVPELHGVPTYTFSQNKVISMVNVLWISVDRRVCVLNDRVGKASQQGGKATCKVVSVIGLVFVPCAQPSYLFCSTLWNSLPEEVQKCPSVQVFKQRLKTYLSTRTFDK